MIFFAQSTSEDDLNFYTIRYKVNKTNKTKITCRHNLRKLEPIETNTDSDLTSRGLRFDPVNSHKASQKCEALL